MNWMRTAWGRWSPGWLFSLFHKTTRCCFMCLIYRIYLTERVLSRVGPPFGFPALFESASTCEQHLCSYVVFGSRRTKSKIDFKIRKIPRHTFTSAHLIYSHPNYKSSDLLPHSLFIPDRIKVLVFFLWFFSPFTLMVLGYWAYFCVSPCVSCQGQLARTSLWNTKQALRKFLFNRVCTSGQFNQANKSKPSC